jgi:hypothetical protein
MKKEVFTYNKLKIEVQEESNTIIVNWFGKSIDRKPGLFITPILIRVFKKSNIYSKHIILNFQKIDYMNSSTITPIIKILERAKRGRNQITVHYNKTLKWQDLIFSALEIFQTRDKRIKVEGV